MQDELNIYSKKKLSYFILGFAAIFMIIGLVTVIGSDEFDISSKESLMEILTVIGSVCLIYSLPILFLREFFWKRPVLILDSKGFRNQIERRGNSKFAEWRDIDRCEVLSSGGHKVVNVFLRPSAQRKVLNASFLSHFKRPTTTNVYTGLISFTYTNIDYDLANLIEEINLRIEKYKSYTV